MENALTKKKQKTVKKFHFVLQFRMLNNKNKRKRNLENMLFTFLKYQPDQTSSKIKKVGCPCLFVINLWVTNRIREKRVFLDSKKKNLLWKLHH